MRSFLVGDRDIHLLRRWKGMNLKMSPGPTSLIWHEKSSIFDEKRDNVRSSYYFVSGTIIIIFIGYNRLYGSNC